MARAGDLSADVLRRRCWALVAADHGTAAAKADDNTAVADDNTGTAAASNSAAATAEFEHLQADVLEAFVGGGLSHFEKAKLRTELEAAKRATVGAGGVKRKFRFSFRQRRGSAATASPAPGPGLSEATPSAPSAAAVTAAVASTAAPAAPLSAGAAQALASARNSVISLTDLTNRIVRVTASAARASVTLSRLRDCLVLLSGPLRAVYLHECQNVALLARDPIDGALRCEGVQRACFAAHAHQTRIHGTCDASFVMCARSAPIVEEVSRLRFAALDVAAGAGNKALGVEDFRWQKAGIASPNFSLAAAGLLLTTSGVACLLAESAPAAGCTDGPAPGDYDLTEEVSTDAVAGAVAAVAAALTAGEASSDEDEDEV